jgi:hypothetical protein
MKQHLYELLRQCTVRVSISGKEGHGTGFFVAPGLILTCAHVVKTVESTSATIRVYWNGQLYPASIMKTLSNPDLALLQASLNEHPCVSLHEEASPFDRLYSFGYPDDHPDGDPATFSLEGKAGEQEEQIKFKTGQVRPGFSGAPLLNVRTGRVCGVVQLTRDRNTDLGGRAITTAALFRAFPELISLQQQYHLTDRRWTNCLELERAEGSRVGHLVAEPFGVRPILAEHRQPARHDCYAHISFPSNYVVRMDVLSHVRDAVLADEPTVALTSAVQYSKPQALHGMGGIGKSVIARALCDDIRVQAAFPDGILWATLGQTPSLVTAMRLWVNALGGVVNENAPTVDSLKVTLAELLKDRACLLILDDVWQRSHADAFRVGGTHCHLLMTTRDAEIAYELGAKVQPIPVMSESEAIILLEEWAGGNLSGADLKLESQIVKRLGYLPLAVKLAGAQLRRKLPDEWLRTFDVRKLKSSRPEDIHDSLELTFGLSLDSLDTETRRLYVSLAIFKEEEATSQAGIERLWHGLANLDTESSRDLLDDLAARALLEVTSYQFSRVVRIHDLLRDLIRAELKDGRVAAHQAILGSYRASYHVKGWHTVADDGYLYDHLAYHLHAAGALDELKGLFINQNWLDVRVPQRDYTYDGYLEDLSLAWECVETETRKQIEANQEPTGFAECLRYALIRTSINSTAENYVPELVARAVEVGAWTARRAMSVVGKVPDATKRAKMYTAILGTGKLNKEQKEEAQQLGLEAALTVPNEEERVETLAALAPYLTDELLERALERGLETTLVLEYEDELAKALVALAPHLTGELLKQALEAALELKDEDKLASVLVALAPHLTGGLLEQALEVALALEDKQEGARVLTALAPLLTGALLEQVLEAILALEDEEARTQVMTALEPQLSDEMLLRARKAKMAELMPHLSDELRERLKTAMELKSAEEQAVALGALEPKLRIELRIDVLERGLETILGLEDEEERAETLEQALGADLAMEYEEERAQILAALKADMSLEFEVERVEMLELVLEDDLPIEPGWEQVEMLKPTTDDILTTRFERVGTSGRAVIPQLTEETRREVLERVLNRALALEYDLERAWVLVALAPQLTEELRERALELALEIILTLQCDWEEAKALIALMPHLVGEQRIKALERGLEAALALKNKREQLEAFAFLAPYLPSTLLDRALEYTLILKQQVDVLTVLAPYLPNSLLERAFAHLEEMQEGKRADALVALAPHLRGKLQERGLKVALALHNEKERAAALLALVPHLTGELHPKAVELALEAVLAQQDKDEREESLAALAPNLTKWQLEQVLKSTPALEYKRERVKALVVLIPYLTGELRLQTLEQVLRVGLALKNRREQVEVVASLAPQLEDELRVQALEQALETTITLEYSQERAEALAALSPHLTGKQLATALEAALVLLDKYQLVEPLAALAQRLTGGLLEHALEMTLVLENKGEPVEALAVLAPWLTGRLLERGFERALKLKSEKRRAKALIALAPYLTERLREPALEAALELSAEEDRAKVLIALASRLKGILLERAFEVALRLRFQTNRANVLIALAPQLTRKMLERAFEAALALWTEEERAKALMALAPRLGGELRNIALEQALEDALALEDVEERGKTLVVLASQLAGSWRLETLESAFEAALELEDEEEQAQALAAFLSQGLHQFSSEKSILQAMICTLVFLIDWSRWDVFRFLQFFIETLFIPQAFSPQILNTVALNVVEICETWHWV